MPFTLSHPAAVLPLLSAGRGRGPLIASALVAGSLAPDAPFFVESLLKGTHPFGRATHHPLALPTLDVAIAAVLVAGWHGLLREPLVALLPDPWADRADTLTAPHCSPGRGPGAHDRRGAGTPGAPGTFGTPGGPGTPGALGAVGTPRDPVAVGDAGDPGAAARSVLGLAARFAGSAAIGAATHVLWDSFTHSGRCGARMLPVLERRIGGMPVTHALQWGSSAAGLGLLAVAGARTLRGGQQTRPRRVVLRPADRRRALGLIAASTVAGAVHRARRELPKLSARPRPTDLVAAVSFGGGAGAVAGAVGYALALRLTSRPAPAT